MIGTLHVAAFAKDSDWQNISIEVEADQCQDFISSYKSRENFEVEKYMPEGAEFTEITNLGDVITLDYTLDGIRYMVDYHMDGYVEKFVKEFESDDLFIINSKNRSIEVIRISDKRETTEIDPQEINPVNFLEPNEALLSVWGKRILCLLSILAYLLQNRIKPN